MSFTNFLMNCNCIKTYIVINEIIVFEICERLQIESCSLFKFKSLREYNDQFVKRSITHYLLFILKIQGHKKILFYFDYSIKIS